MAKTPGKYPDIKELSFEKSLKELEQIVSRLERGDVELEESINIWESMPPTPRAATAIIRASLFTARATRFTTRRTRNWQIKSSRGW